MTLEGHLTSSEIPHVPKSDLQTRFLTASNLVSGFRALLTIPFILVMLPQTSSSRFWGGLIMVLAAVTDKVDGMLARRLHQTSEWGKIFDPLADKIAMATGVIVLLILQAIPLWFVCAVLGRDALIFAGGIYVKTKYGIIMPSNLLGKCAAGAIALTMFGLVIGIPSAVTDALLFVSTVMLVASFALYVKRVADIQRRKQI